MRFYPVFKVCLPLAAACLFLQAQGPRPAEAQPEVKGLPPRASAADYQAQAQAGAVTIAAEFKGHSVPTADGTLSTAEFVVVETALFGAPGARTTISSSDFSLRVNGRKQVLPSQPFGLVLATLKDPEWAPPAAPESKGKTSMSSGGQRDRELGAPPVEVKVPIEVQRSMAQRTQKAALPEGDRVLPQAGLIFFEYRGKAQGIRSIELTYAGPAGKATLALQP